MSIFDFFKTFLVLDESGRNVTYENKKSSMQDKYVKVRSNGTEKQYRINKYGEVFEE